MAPHDKTDKFGQGRQRIWQKRLPIIPPGVGAVGGKAQAHPCLSCQLCFTGRQGSAASPTQTMAALPCRKPPPWGVQSRRVAFTSSYAKRGKFLRAAG